MSKVLKINNICDSDHLADCGVPSSFTDLAGGVVSSWPVKLSELNQMFTGTYDAGTSSIYQNPQSHIDTRAAAFETQNGEAITLYYNPFCKSDIDGDVLHYSQPKMCANFVYDLNGNKGPNSVGKDIGFITALYPTDTNVVAPYLLPADVGSISQIAASAACTALDEESRLPNRDEASAMFYNRLFLGLMSGGIWTSSVISPSKAWFQSFTTGDRNPYTRTYSGGVRCVKR